MTLVPYRGTFGDPRPARLSAIRLPPDPMPGHAGPRALKAWRYVGIFGADVMVCVAAVRIGPARQAFWALWDRAQRRLEQRTTFGSGSVELRTGRVIVRDRALELDVRLEEAAGIETVCPHGRGYAWTRKQGGVRAVGACRVRDRDIPIDARAVIDDTSAYYERHTRWRWCAGVGHATDGKSVAWNLVSGVNDPPRDSERTVWVAGEPAEVGPVRFAEDLSGVDGLRFAAEAVRERRENLVVVRSCYRQPFGSFAGVLPSGVELADGYGVMEDHEVWW